MFGITPMPIYDPKQKIRYLRDFMILFKPGDMVQFKPIDRAGYDQIVDHVANDRFELRIRPVTFVLEDFHKDPAGYARKLEEALNGN
jgi:urea carboxylase